MSAQIKGYIIYNPVYRQIKKVSQYIKRNGYRNYIVNTWNVCLDKLEDKFDMRLVWVKADDPDFIEFLDKLTKQSNNHHFWNKRPSISIDQKDGAQLEEFIEANKLSEYIEKIQTQTQLSIIRVIIKIVTFHPRIVSNKILANFTPPLYVEHRQSLFMAKAYEWLAPENLPKCKTKKRYRYTHVIIYLLLDYYRMRRRRRNICVLNLFDLCALRLAMFDPRYYQFDQCEIPGLIHKELRSIVDRRKNLNTTYGFTPVQYMIDQGVESVPSTVAEYFLIYASDYCNFVSKRALVAIDFSYEVAADDYVRLHGVDLYEQFLIDFVQKRPFLEIVITSHSQALSSKALGDIIKFKNVYTIDIDTSFHVELEPFNDENSSMIENNILLVFYRSGDTNYLQNYMGWLKPVTKCRKLSLLVRCPVVDYTIFNDVGFEEVTFLGHEINSKMIAELQKSELNTIRYKWEKATLEKHVDIIKMLHDLELCKGLELALDENTFMAIFLFIEVMLRANERTELEFGGDLVEFNITVLPDDYEKLDLSEFVFKLNSEQLKIEMYRKSSKKVVDLYDILFKIDTKREAEDIYEFYQ